MTADTAALAPGQRCFISSLVFTCLRPSEVLIYRSNRSSPAGLQENAPKAHGRDWKYRHLRNFTACLINMRIAPEKLKSLRWQTQGRELSSLVWSCPSGHPPSVSVEGSQAKGHLWQQPPLLQANPRPYIPFWVSLSNTLRFSSHLACAL